jgi:hypothetical protein
MKEMSDKTAAKLYEVIQRSDSCEFLGSGVMGQAHSTPSGRTVVKTYTEDYAYNEFVDFIEGAYPTTALPKIYARNWDGESGIVVMEALHPLPPLVTRIISNGGLRGGYITPRHLYNETLRYVDTESDNPRTREKAWRQAIECKHLFTEDFCDIVTELVDLASDYGIHADIHAGNVMLRKVKHNRWGQLVVIDPWYNGRCPIGENPDDYYYNRYSSTSAKTYSSACGFDRRTPLDDCGCERCEAGIPHCGRIRGCPDFTSERPRCPRCPHDDRFRYQAIPTDILVNAKAVLYDWTEEHESRKARVAKRKRCQQLFTHDSGVMEYV